MAALRRSNAGLHCMLTATQKKNRLFLECTHTVLALHMQALGNSLTAMQEDLP